MEPNEEKFWQKPSRKWFTAQVIAGLTLVGSLLTGDPEVTDQEVLLILGYIGEAITTYILPNAKEDR